MAQIKKNQLANILFPMVDATDFASVESAITASDFNSAATKKFYGVTHGNSTAFTSGTISKATSLVRSGIFQQTLKATETNYDYLLVRFTHPSCADQFLVFHCVDYDDSDIFSQLSDIGSNLLSYMTGLSATLSDVDSQLLLNASMISDTYSLVSDVDSQVLLNASMISDVDSQLLVTHSLLSDVESQVDLLATSNYLSQVHSDLTSQIGGITASIDASDMSDIASRVWATTEGTRVDSRILVIQSMVSDVDSQVNLLATSDYLSQVHSDLYSAIGGVTASIDASDMSDIASRVWATTEGTRVDSRILIIQSMVSDVDSQVLLNASMISDTYSLLSDHHSDFQSRITGTLADTSDMASAVWAADYSVLGAGASSFGSYVQGLATSNYLSQVHSDLTSQIGGITASIDASDMSDIASRVWATTEGTRVDSRILVIQSMVSDVDSQVLLNASIISDVQSALDSQFAYLSNAISDAHSDLGSQIGDITASIDASDMSDIASRVWATTEGTRVDSRILVIQSLVSDVDSQVLLNASMISDVQSALDSQFAYLSGAISDAHSDLGSQIGGITASIDASDISDIASRVWSEKYTTHSAASSFGSLFSDVYSRVVLIQSNVSDVDSQLLVTHSLLSDVESQVDLLATSNYLSQVHSDLTSQIGGITASIDASDMSDIASRVWATTEGTRVDSRILVIQSMVSDVDSQLLVTHSLLSDVESQVDLLATSDYLSQVHSDLYSAIGGVTASIDASDMSDIASRVWATTEGTRVDSRILVIQSMVSDVDSQVNLLATSDYLSQVHSDLYSAIGGVTASIDASDMSDIASRVWATTEGTRVDSRILVIQSMVSDVDSQVNLLATSDYLSQVHSDLASAIGGVTASIDASDMSDIASRVWATTEGTRVDSRILVIQSMVSDVDSQVNLLATSDYLSQVHSDLRSQVSGITASIDASDMSDIASRVWATTEGTRVDSRILVIQSMVSDVDSQVNLLATSDYLSQVHSDLRSQVSGITTSIDASDISDIASAVWADTIGARVDSRILVIQSNVSDVESQVDLLATSNYLSQVHSDLASQIGGIPTSVTASDMSDIASRVWATAEGTRVDSRILVLQSNLSDVESQVDLLATSDYLSQVHSDLASALGNVSLTLTASNLSDIASAVGGRQIPDSYATDGSQPTIEQAILAIAQFLQERAVTGTTVTVKKPDGSTTAMTFTLDDATDPTSITRAS